MAQTSAEVISKAFEELTLNARNAGIVDHFTEEARRETAREEEERAPDRTILQAEVLNRSVARVTIEE